jgi:hypothetical protein
MRRDAEMTLPGLGRLLIAAMLCAGSVLASGSTRAQAPAVATPPRESGDRAARVALDRQALLDDLRVLSSDEMRGRAAGTPGGARARAYLLEQFRAAGLQPPEGGYEASFPLPVRTAGAPARVGVNVVGLLAGSTTPTRYVVVTAHYDHEGVHGDVVFNGANDNASGAAALPHIARHFARHQPAHSLLFVAFDAEELGLLGARAFVEQPPVPRESMLANLNLDMIGRSPDNILYVVGAHHQPGFRPIVERVAPRVDVILRMDYDGSTARDDWTRQSDQFAFMQAGIPALFLSVEDFEQLHKPTDDYETMSYDFYVRSVQAAIALIDEFDRSSLELAAMRGSRRPASAPRR